MAGLAVITPASIKAMFDLSLFKEIMLLPRPN
jgi:hypothetical protein